MFVQSAFMLLKLSYINQRELFSPVNLGITVKSWMADTHFMIGCHGD